MLNKFLFTAAALGATALSLVIPAMAQAPSTQLDAANYAGYWLLIQTYTTAPSHTLEPTASEPEGLSTLLISNAFLILWALHDRPWIKRPLRRSWN